MKCPNLDCPVRSRSCERFPKKEQEGAKSCSTRSNLENARRFTIIFASNNDKATEKVEQ